MTAVDHVEFSITLRDLFAAYRKEPDQATAESYWDGLEDLEIALVQNACSLAKRVGRYVPTVREIREQAEIVRERENAKTHGRALARKIGGEVYCVTCQDCGFAYVDKATRRGLPEPPMGSHADFFVRPCECRSRNPIYRASVASQRRQGQDVGGRRHE